MASVLRLIGFQGRGRKGERLVGAPIKKRSNGLHLKIFPFYNRLSWHLNFKYPISYAWAEMKEERVLLMYLFCFTVCLECQYLSNVLGSRDSGYPCPAQIIASDTDIKEDGVGVPFYFVFIFQPSSKHWLESCQKCLVLFPLFCELACTPLI